MTFLGFDVIEKKDGPKHPEPLHPVLPPHEFSMLIVAPKGSGKTNFICNLLLKHYKGYFNKVWICSPTVNNDDKWEVVADTKHVLKENRALDRALNANNTRKKIKKVVFTSDIAKKFGEDVDNKFDGKIPKEDFFSNMSQLDERLQAQQETIEKLQKLGKGAGSKYIADRLLIILDDQAGQYKGTNFNNPIVNYVIKHRHYSSSCIIVTQAYKAIPKTIRTNCNAVILFEIPNLNELKSIYEENPEGLNEKDWMRVYRHCTEKPFSFMYMNSKFPRGKRIYCNFDTMIQLGQSNLMI